MGVKTHTFNPSAKEMKEMEIYEFKARLVNLQRPSPTKDTK